ncbi:CHAT domain-containing protein [Chroococcidiopsis sp. CCMEE 29]|uniref:CHAT domain-containing protein n=1 Tax=Chroococcidiopsis sp. CCMEE 29 TaxID=155894 RepID=UPI002020FEB7|nr:CHAT domain-containing protein [Chroococcidiopsis sp. CCMEE 29]
MASKLSEGQTAKTRLGTQPGEVVAQEFKISVTPLEQGDYLIRTEKVAPGVPVAQEQVTLPLRDWLIQADQLLNNCLNNVAENSLNLVNLGQQLYNALFQGSVQASWMNAQTIAQQQQEVLQLRLGIKDPQLASLPWEIIHAGDRFLATDPSIAFSRYQANAALVAPDTTSTLAMSVHSLQPDVVKVLTVIALPHEPASLTLKQEFTRLQTECQAQQSCFAPGGSMTALQITILEQPGRGQLTQALGQEQYQVLHYIGFSNLGATEAELYLSSSNGLTETLTGDQLADMLVNNGIQIAIFNFIHRNSLTPSRMPQAKLIESLIKYGINGVLTMAECIPDEVVVVIARLFYRHLSQGHPVAHNLTQVRQELISVYGLNKLYWALPILYLHPKYNGCGELIDLATGLDALGEEEWDDLVDEIEDDDPGYEEDAALVADLFRQLANPAPTTNSPISTDALDHLSEIAQTKDENLSEVKTPVSDTASGPMVQKDVKSSPTSPAPPAPPALPASSALFKTPGIRIASSLVGVAAIALLGLWWQNRETILEYFLRPIPQSFLAKIADVNLKTASTSDITAIAVEHFRKGNLSAGYLAVEELLNRGALQNASKALAASPQQTKTSAIAFLWGRLTWQFVQVGYKNYSLDDARRYWEAAVKAQPDSPHYRNALGFAYYAEDKLQLAYQTWFEALYLVEEQQAAKITTFTISTSTLNPSLTKGEATNAYAGLALVLHKAAPDQPKDQREKFVSTAIKLRQKVLTDDPVSFQPQSLGKNWLWTEKAIQDWQSLLQQKSDNYDLQKGRIFVEN